MENYNKLKKRVKEQFSKSYFSEKPPIPKKNFLIEVTNTCNHKCIFCANRKMTRKKGQINFNLLKKLLKEAFTEGIREVGFYSTGEPLLYKNLEAAVKEAKNIGYEYVYITTNGTLAQLPKIIPLIKAGLDSIKFSINAINKDTYKLIHGIDQIDTVKQNIKSLYNYREETHKDFKIFISFIANKYNFNEINDFQNYFSEFCDDILIYDVINQGGYTPEIKSMLTHEKTYNKDQTPIKIPCNLVFESINISYEGYLTACCTDFQNYLAVEDLNKMPLKEAWHSHRFSNFRKSHLNRNVKGTLCHNCVTSSKEAFHPLNKSLACKISSKEIFDEKACSERINKYKNQKGDN